MLIGCLLRVLKGVSRLFRGCLGCCKGVLMMFQGNQRGVLRVFHMYFKRVSGCFKNVSIVVEGIFKGVSEGELKKVSWKFLAVS